MWQQYRACRRQSHLPCVSFKEVDPELALESLDPLREGRLRDMQALGSMSEMTGVGDFDKCSELSQFHRCIDYGEHTRRDAFAPAFGPRSSTARPGKLAAYS
jgi:hypothetical protein